MKDQLVPKKLLEQSSKILFLTHMALGDFVYLQNFFKKARDMYPMVTFDLWVDEGRGKPWFLRRKKKGRYILYDWLEASPFFNHIYKGNGGAAGLRSFLDEAKQVGYDAVISLGTIKKHNYASYAKVIAGESVKIGFAEKTGFANVIKNYNFNCLDKKIRADLSERTRPLHISALYAYWFEQLFGATYTKQDRALFLDIPKEWISYAKLKFLKWGINTNVQQNRNVVFVNCFAKNKKRCWDVGRMLEMVYALSRKDTFYNAVFIVNVLPSEYKRLQKMLKNHAVNNIFLFTASHNFFQLPAIISLCNLVISVETSVMHFAAALNVPVVALMRQKTPEWVPRFDKSTIVWTKKRGDWIKNIQVGDVLTGVFSYLTRVKHKRL